MTDETDKPASKPPAFVSLRARRRVQYIFGVPPVVAIIYALLVLKIPDVNVWDLPELPLLGGCGAVVVGYAAFTFLWWRCPLCNSFFGRDFHPETCAKCGVYFEDRMPGATMRIERLTYKEHDTGWELTPTEFFPGVTLLVGASGVGKTRILQAIQTLKSIAQGRQESTSFLGAEWDLSFSLSEGRQFRWSGRFSGLNDRTVAWSKGAITDNGYRDTLPWILKEELLENGTPLIQRNADSILLDGKQMPKLSPNVSCLSLLSHEDKIAAAHQGLAHVLTPSDDPVQSRFGYVRDFMAYYDNYPTLEAIRASKLPTQHKLALTCRNATEEFLRIVEQYREIFPSVEQLGIRIETLDGRPHGPQDLQETRREGPRVILKEKGCASWIPQEQISSGMWRTLMHLARIALWPDGTVVLIDEFENSLGINCLDYVTDGLNSNSRRLQFIITSHHPYVIHNISWKQWKILRRKGSVVTASGAEELGFDIRSKHDAFIKLINIEEYREGIAVP